MPGTSFQRAAGALLLVLATACRDGGGERRPALLVTLDTTRADAIGCFGGRPGITPSLDAFAEESVRYRWARTVAPLTLPSHCSMLTGLYPPRHTVRDNNVMRLPESATTLAERAHEAGFATAAFVSAHVLDTSLGVAQGFDTYEGPRPPDVRSSTRYRTRPAREVVDAALGWLSGQEAGEPWFLWVHLFDPHAPYEPGPEFLEQAGGDAYLGEVAQADYHVGRLLDAVRARGDWPELTVLVVADHGEGLGEHGEPTHSTLVYDSTLRVPMMLRLPGGPDAGTMLGKVVSVVDVYPTLVSAMGLGRARDVDGVDLASKPPPDRGVYFETFDGFLNYGWAPLAGWADASGKYVHSSTAHLFDPVDDPGELVGRAPSAEEDARYRRSIEHVLSARALTRREGERAGEDVARELQALGYAAAGDAEKGLPHPLDPTDRLDPLERTDELAACIQAADLLERGRPADAIPLLESVVRSNPRNLYARNVLAGCLVAVKRFAEAVPVLEGLLADGPEWASVHYNLAACLERSGEPGRAVRHYRRALELDPEHRGSLASLARLLAQKRPKEAATYRERLKALGEG